MQYIRPRNRGLFCKKPRKRGLVLRRGYTQMSDNKSSKKSTHIAIGDHELLAFDNSNDGNTFL